MQVAARLVLSACVLTSALASAYHNGAKLRRDGVLNLYPFPRVGRASHRSWQLPPSDLYLGNNAKLRRDDKRNLYPFPPIDCASACAWQLMTPSDLYLANELQYEPIDKRQLYAFPRVGRADESLLQEPQRGAQLLGMPHRRNDGPGMWFGPRLGRSFRSEDEDITEHSENSERSDPEQVEVERNERDARQTALARKNLDSI